MDRIAADRDRRLNGDRLGRVADAVDVVGEAIDPVGDRPDDAAHHPFRLGLHGLEIGAKRHQAMAPDELEITALADRAGGELSPQIAQYVARLARVLADDLEQRVVRPAGFVELEDGDAQPLLKNIRCVHGRAARGDAADVAMVGHGAGPADQFLRSEHRLDDVEIGQMLAGRAVGIVEEVDVARRRGRPMIADQKRQAVGEGAELDGQGQALGDDLAIAIGDRGGVVHRIAHHGRIGRAHDDQRHLVGDRAERVLDYLEGDRIDVGTLGHAWRISMLPSASSRAVAPGGTTQVASYSSTMKGPERGLAVSAARARTGVSTRP